MAAMIDRMRVLPSIPLLSAADNGWFTVVKKEHGNIVTPMFITCDPARDTPAVVRCHLASWLFVGGVCG